MGHLGKILTPTCALISIPVLQWALMAIKNLIE